MKVTGDFILQGQRLGFIVQQYQALVASTFSTTASVPTDGTIPQITEGTEFVTFTITPQRIGNIIHIMGSGFCNSGTAVTSMAVHRAGTNDALITSCSFPGLVQSIFVEYRDPVTSLSSLTYSIRVGSSTGAACSVGVNAYYGAAGQSIAVITEYSPA